MKQIAALVLALAALAGAARADVVLDGTLGPKVSVENPDAPGHFAVDESHGTLRGPNLFHSFSEFNLEPGQSAEFTATSPIRNVISRVTGGPSTLGGTLISRIPGARFFFLNPAGVTFTQGAQLDVAGSVQVSTADYLELGSDPGQRFHANPARHSVLSPLEVTAFGFLGASPAPIRMLGGGPDSRLLRTGELSLIGGEITLEGTGLNAPAGRIELVSAASAGRVVLRADGLDASDLERLGWIRLSDGTLDVRGDRAGSIVLQADRIAIERSLLETAAQTSGSGGGIRLDARGDIAIAAGSAVRAEMRGAGQGPGIELRAGGSLQLNDSQVAAEAIESRGAGGSIAVEARDLQVRDSELRTAARSAAGDAGDVRVHAERDVSIANGFVGSLSTGSSADPLGGAGSVSVSAADLTVSGSSGGLAARINGSGGGRVDVDLEVQRLRILDGAQVGVTLPQFFTSPELAGPSLADVSSVVQIRAEESVDVEGGRLLPRRFARSSIENDNVDGADDPGHPRLIHIETPELTVGDTALIRSSTLGRGNAGDILLEIGNLRVLGAGAISSSAGGAPLGGATTGSGGRLEIRASGTVEVAGRHPVFPVDSLIDSNTTGSGDGGVIDIHAARLIVDAAEIRASTTAFPAAIGASGKAGNAGDIILHVGRLEVRDGGSVQVDAAAFANGPLNGSAGNIQVTAGSAIVAGTGLDPGNGQERRSQLSSGTSTAGAGGNVSIRSRELAVLDGAEITAASTGTGRAGDVGIDAARIRVENGGSIQTSARNADGGNIEIAPGQRLVLRGGNITTEGSGNGGNVRVGSELTVLRDGEINADAGDGNGGSVRLDSRFLIGGADQIHASSERGLPGTISTPSPELSLIGALADLPATFLAAQKLLRPQCALRDPRAAGSFVVAERSGVASSPEGWLLAFDGDEGDGPAAVALGTQPGDRLADARSARTRGAKALRSGQLSAAQREFEAASRSPEAQTRSGALRGQAQVQQASGEYRDSVRSLLEALLIAEQSGDAVQIASVLGSLGNAYVALEEPALAEDHLRRGLAVAREVGAWDVAARILINQGNQRAIQGQLDAALASYREAADLVGESGPALHRVQALANGARVSAQAGDAASSASLLERASAELAALPATNDKIQALVHIAQSELLLARPQPATAAARMLRAHGLLMQAVKLAAEVGADRSASYALGSLGALYERDHRYEEALQATRRAVLAAEQAGAPEALYRLHWQAGRLLSLLQRPEDALDAYRRAVSIVQRLRPEAAFSYTRSQVSFRDSVAPVYLALVDALLQKASAQSDAPSAQPLLREARATEESMRAAELRDYFRDECVAELAQRERPLESVAADAAIVYPVLLPERMELLVSIGGTLHSYRMPVSASAVREQALRLREALENPQGQQTYLEPAQQLYRWLVAPYAADLERAGVGTLVFVPDGALRTIPMAALHDGHDFLIRRFALAITPGLSLTDPRPLERSHLKVLVAGLSESVQGFPELPHVAEEVEAIHALYGGTVLLNEQFTESRAQQALAGQSFSVVHIASHGAFTGDVARSFLLTHDGRISLQQLSEWIGRMRFRDPPLELLVLSGCETAAGDERAALGLSGVAIRSGARSAVGSLWSIEDEASSRLIAEFYAQLRNPELSRAQALRRAQLALLDQGRFQNPGYWSAFLLINSWL